MKKYPSGHLQDPSLLLVADTTHCEQVVADEQLEHPEEQGMQIPFWSK